MAKTSKKSNRRIKTGAKVKIGKKAKTAKKGKKEQKNKAKKSKTVNHLVKELNRLFSHENGNVDHIEINLSDMQANKNINKKNDTKKNEKVVLIHMNGCYYCEQMMPEYLRYKEQRINDGLGEDTFIEIERSDLDNGLNRVNELLSEPMEPIQGYPTIGIIKDGRFIKFEGERTVDGFGGGLL